MIRPTWGLVYWPVFIAATVAAFAGPELAALFTNPRNTLSDFSWYELGVGGRYDPRTWVWWVSLIGFLAVIVTLTGHIWFRVPD